MKKHELKWKIQCLEIEKSNLEAGGLRVQAALDRANKTICDLVSAISENKYTSKIKKCKYCGNYQKSLIREDAGQCAVLRGAGADEKLYYKCGDDSCKCWTKRIQEIKP